jgi:histidinol-phosphate aminotransferase
MKDIDALMRPNIRRMKPYSSARHEFEGEAELFLDANENPFNNGLNRYPDPLQQALKQKIADIKAVKAEQIFLGNGSDEAIDLLFRIFCEPSTDNVIILPPTYGMYQVAADIANVEIREVPLNKDFQPDFYELSAVWDEHTKIIFFCSPNNPTGNSLDADIMEKVLNNFHGIVVVDEAYIDFSEQLSFLNMLGRYNNLVVMQTLSKAWGLAGIRLGMAFASTGLIQLFNKVKAPYNINQLTQEKALEILEQNEATKSFINIILEQRKILEKKLPNFTFVKKLYPSDANFILVKVDHANALYNFLLSNKIVVRNRSSVPGCEDCLRITVGTPEENQILLDALLRYEQSVQI